MALAARYILRRAKNTGKVAVTFEVRDIPASYTSGGETKTDLGGRWDQSQSLWYGRASDQTGPALTWDTTNNVPGADNPTTWENTLTRIDGTSDVSTVTVAYNDGVVTVTGLRDVPVSFDASAIKNKDTSVWTQTSGSNYANIICEADTVMELYGIYVAPHIESLTLTGPAAGTMVYRAGSYDTGSQTVTPSSVVLQISRDPNFRTLVTLFNVNPELSAGTGEHSTVITGLETETLYYMRLAVSYTGVAVSAEDCLSNVAQLQTQRQLSAPVVTGVSALDGAGSVSWGSVENAAGYEIALVDSASAVPVSGSAAASPWNFNEATSGTTVQGKYIRIRALAVANQYEWGTSEWSAGTLIPDNRTPEEEEPVTPVEINMARLPFKAIPRIDVPVEQIGANGSSPKDVITVEYANEHYVQSGGEIPASQLPIATSSDLGAIKVGSHLSINATTGVLSVSDTGAIASGNTGLVTGGTVYAETSKYAAFADKSIATSVTDGNTNPVTSGAVYTFVTDAGNLPKAKSAGGAGNAGIVYISNAQGENGLGLKIDTTNDGLLSVNFATYSEDAATVTTKAVHPKYVADAIDALSLGTAATKDTGTSEGNVPILDANGKLDTSVIPDLAITDITTKTDKVRYGTGQTYTDRAAAIAAKLPTIGIQKGDVYIYAPSLSDAEQKEGGYLVGTFIYTGSAWQEMYTPVDGVITVNGKYGPNVTLSASDVSAIPSSYLETTLTTTSDEKVPSSKAVATYVTGRGYQTSSQVSTLISGAGATWTTGTSAWNDTGTGYVSVTYLKNALNDYDSDVMTTVQGMLDSQTHVSEDITDSISAGTGITDAAAGLVQGKAVYAYAAPKSHTHTSANISDSISAGTGITSTETKLVQAKAVYEYQPLITRVKLDATNGNFAGVYHNSNSAPSLSTDNKYLATAYSILKWIADAVDDVEISVTAQYGLTYSSKTLAITRANGTGTYGTVVQSSSANGVTISDGVISLTWANYSTSGDRTSAVKVVNPAYVNAYIADQSSVTGAANKLVKFDADGYIDAFAILCDDQYLYVQDAQSETGIGRLTIDRDQLLSGMASQTWANQQYVKQGAIVPVWSSSGTYVIGDVVEYNGKVYRKTNTGSSGTSPGMVSSGWTETSYASTTKYTGTITGDGTTTSFDVTHNLGVTDVDVTLIDNNTGQEVYTAVTMVSSSVVRIGFGAAPDSGKVYRVVVRK